MNEQEIKDQLCDICHKMWQLGWVAANDGNVSVKLDDGTFFCNANRYEQELYHARQVGTDQRQRGGLRRCNGTTPVFRDQDAPMLLSRAS